MKIKKNSLLILLLLLVLACIFFWKPLLSPDKIIFSNYSDITANSGLKHDISDSFKKYGEIPLWNPYVFSGSPIISNIIYSVFYPFNNFFLTFPVDSVFTFYFLLHVFLSAIAIYFFTRTLKLDKISSIISAIVFIFSGYFILQSAFGHIQHVSSFLWIPISFLFSELILTEKKFIYGIFLSISLALQFFSGLPQYFVYTILSLIFYFLFRVSITVKKEKKVEIFKLSTILSISLIIFFLISSVQLFPFLEFSKYSNRSGGISYYFATLGSLPPWHLVTFFVPEFFGTPIDDSYISTTNFWELASYIGIFPLILSLLAILFKRNKYTIFFTLLAIFSLLFAFGKYTPLFSTFYNFVPGFDMFRIPARFLIFFVFSLSVLSGFGSNFLINKIKAKDKKRLFILNKVLFLAIVFVILSTIFVVLNKGLIISIFEKLVTQNYESFSESQFYLRPIEYYLSKIPFVYSYILNGLSIFLIFLFISTALILLKTKNRISLKHFKTLIIIVIFLDLAYFGMKYINVENPERFFAKQEAVRFLEKDPELYRVVVVSNTPLSIIRQYVASRYEVQLVEGVTGVQIEHFKKFLDLVGNRSLLIRDPEPIQNIYYPQLLDLHETSSLHIYKNNNHLPRTFVVPNAKVLSSEQEIFDELRSNSFNSKQYIILEEDPNVSLNNPSTYKEANISYYSPNKITVSVNLENSGFLVLSEVWYPGWKAYDNGKEVKIYKTDYTLRSIYLERGNHIVEFVYDSDSFKYGIWITTITLLGTAIYFTYLIIAKIRQRQRKAILYQK